MEENKELLENTTENKEKQPETQTEGQTSVKQTKIELFWEIFHFLLVGGTATVCDYIVFWLLDGVLLPKLPFSGAFWALAALWLATACGFVVGMIVNWLLSIKFVFRAVRNKEEAKSAKSFWIFVIISVIGLALTLVGVWLISKFLPEFTLFGRTDFFGTTWSKWVAKIIMTCIVLVWNYLGRKIFIFKS